MLHSLAGWENEPLVPLDQRFFFGGGGTFLCSTTVVSGRFFADCAVTNCPVRESLVMRTSRPGCWITGRVFGFGFSAISDTLQRGVLGGFGKLRVSGAGWGTDGRTGAGEVVEGAGAGAEGVEVVAISRL